MSLVKNLSESDRIRRVKIRTEYSNYFTSRTRFESGLSPDFIKVEGGSGLIRADSIVGNYKLGPIFLTPTEYNNIIVNNSPSNGATSVSYSVPGAPTGVVATTGASGVLTVSWTAPTSTGGSPILSYTITSTPGSIVKTSATTSVTYTGLTNGTPYTFIVTATNVAGTSLPSSPSAGVAPFDPGAG